MHLAAHVVTSIPFLVTGHYLAALGCVLPDITWTYMEYRFRKSKETSWYAWSKTITARQLIPYRMAHSFLLVALLLVTSQFLFGSSWLFLGWFIHLILDLPTHWGVMRPLPLYPFNWSWPYVFKYIKERNKET